jgi:hypothetical protein
METLGLTANSTAVDTMNCDEDLVNKSFLDYFASFDRERANEWVKSTSKPAQDSVLVCGAMVRLVQKNGSTCTISLWVKRKTTLDKRVILIWIFAPIDQQQVNITVSNGTVRLL